MQRFTGVDPLASKFSAVSPISLIDPDGREVIAPNAASQKLVLQSVTYMFGKDHGYTFEGNKLVHNGTTPSGMSSGQQKMFSFFNGALVNSKMRTTVLAGQSSSTLEDVNGPKIVQVAFNAGGETFLGESFIKIASGNGMSIPVRFPAENLILITNETIINGINVMTYGGLANRGAEHATSHELAHGIVNTIMNEFGGQFNGIDFNPMSGPERQDWAIKFTNSLYSGDKRESGEGQHKRDEKTRPTHSLDGLQH
jgi:hypothetical protein